MVGRKEEQHDNGSKRVVCNPEKLNAKTGLRSYNILTLFRTYTLLTTLTTLICYLSIYWDGGAKTQLPSTKEGNVTGLEYAEDTWIQPRVPHYTVLGNERHTRTDYRR